MLFVQPEEQWTATITAYREALNAVRIPHDIMPVQAKYILSQLDEIFQNVRPQYGKISAELSEVDNLIERIRKKSEERGNNTEMRKANGIRSVENAERGDTTTINLYDLRNVLAKKHEELKSILDVLDKKQSLVITMSGWSKLESNITGH